MLSVVLSDHVSPYWYHERDGPKLPYQAVVIRQSAKLQNGSECHSAE